MAEKYLPFEIKRKWKKDCKVIEDRDLAFLNEVISLLLRVSHIDPEEIWDDYNKRMEVINL